VPGDRLTHVSLLIDLDSEWWLPNLKTYSDTATYLPRRSRRLVHESVHYWHQLVHGHLLLVAAEDWARLLSSEQGGTDHRTPTRSDFGRPGGAYGLSTRDLTEAAARVWDVLVLGADAVLRSAVADLPSGGRSDDLAGRIRRAARDGGTTSEGTDLAMRVSGAYGLCYSAVRRRLGAADALVAFPFLVHFALRTDRPVAAFDLLLETMAADLAAEARRRSPAGGLTEELMSELYDVARRQCRAIAEREATFATLDVREIYHCRGLADNPAYQWAFRHHGGGSDARVEELERAVCLPVFPRYLSLLTQDFLPPGVRFRDRRVLALPPLALPDSASADDQTAALEGLRAALAIQERWDVLRANPRAIG
jgi:hypothetical protein